MLASVWRYRHFIVHSVFNEFYKRFANSKLGGLWLIINPLTQVLIYALVLTNVLGNRLPDTQNKYSYAIYLLAGILCWSLFAEMITRCMNVFIEQSNLIKKMSFPRITLPCIVMGACLLNNLCLLFCTFIIFVFMGQIPDMAMLIAAPFLILVTLAFALGIGLILGILNVFLRDIAQGVPILLQIWFWFTPIVYPESIIPESYRAWLGLNPIYKLIQAYHDVFLYGVFPSLISLGELLIISACLLFIGLFLFRRASPEMVDVL